MKLLIAAWDNLLLEHKSSYGMTAVFLWHVFNINLAGGAGIYFIILALLGK